MITKTKNIIIKIDNIEAISNEIDLDIPHLEIVTIMYTDARNREKEHSFILNLN
jgi:hypothetical protein